MMVFIAALLCASLALVSGFASKQSHANPGQGNTTTTRTSNPDGSTTITITTTYQDGSTTTNTTYDKDGYDAGTTRVDKQTRDGETTTTTTTYDGKGHETGKTIERVDKNGDKTIIVIDPATGGVKSSTTVPAQPTPEPPQPAPSPWLTFKIPLKYMFTISPGLRTETFTLPSGNKISVNFPDDMSAGDTITGTIEAQVSGKDEKERARNLREIDRIVLLIGGQPTTATERIFTRTLPLNINVSEPFLVMNVNGKQAASMTEPIAKNPPRSPENLQLPACGQTGRNIVVKDRCDGVISPTDSCTIGGTTLPPLAESPRMRVLQNTNQTPGPTQIKYVEQGREANGPFQNLGVNISSPNTNLLRNQTTTVEVVAQVLGIRQDVSLDLTNDTPQVVSISGGDRQHFTIHPSDVQADGTYKKEFTVAANQTGNWGATATVSCEGESNAPPATGPQAPASPAGLEAIISIPATPTPTPLPGGAAPTPSASASPSPSPCAPTPTPTTYSVKDLKVLATIDGSTPSCIATGVNDAGNVVGTCFGKYAGGASRAFRTDSGGAVIKPEDDLGLPAGVTGGYSFATGVNAYGHVVGYWSGGGDKAFWHDGLKASKMINLHPEAFMTSKAFGVNIHDDVVGAAYAPKFGPVFFGLTFDGHAVIWPHVDAGHKAMTDLNDGVADDIKKDWILKAAFGIKDDGDIVGRAYNKKTGKYHAFLLKGVGGKFFDLGALKEDVFDSSAAYALNACDAVVPEIDNVVGYTYTDSKTYPGKSFHYGFVWTDGVGLTEMETLPPYSTKPDPLESFLQAINTKTETVGAVSFAFHLSQTFEYEVLGPGPILVGASCVPNSHAVWYNGKDLKDLNKLIPGSPGWELNLANGINEKSWIVGSGFYKCSTAAALSSSKLSKAVLLIPAASSATGAAGTVSTTACPLSIPTGGYIFDNWNVCGVKNGPTKDATFTIDAPNLITFIATYHWNFGKGALPAKGISLKDSSGKILGPWDVTTSAGSGGAANVNWECHPGVVLPAGTYTIIDPDPVTWSQNDASGNKGFVRVAGSPKK